MRNQPALRRQIFEPHLLIRIKNSISAYKAARNRKRERMYQSLAEERMKNLPKYLKDDIGLFNRK